MTEPTVTLQTAQDLGLSRQEYDRVLELLGRTPNFAELSVFSVMWSEHQSYKNSTFWLKTLPREEKRLLESAGGHNAGLVDIGDGQACALRMESHNRPVADPPLQAADPGGLHHSLFAMGARPFAALHSLRFGNYDPAHTPGLMREVWSALSRYADSLGVPTTGGELYFHDSYNQTILINVLSAGIVRQGESVSPQAAGPGNPVFIVGSPTGREGIRTVAFAAAGGAEDPAEDRAADPLQEKLLLEATLEAAQTGAAAAIRSIGTAGIAGAAAEMSAPAGTGMRIHLDQAPTHRAGMRSWETLLSQSRERMLVVGYKGREQELTVVFDKWDLACEQIGEVTETGRLEFFHHGEPAADLPAQTLVRGGGAPAYQPEYSKPEYLRQIARFNPALIPSPDDYPAVARRIAGSPNIAGKRWIRRQGDPALPGDALHSGEPSDAAVIRLPDSPKALVLTCGCNPAYVYADPYAGAVIAVAEAARNIVCSGGQPLAVTTCLNFGNPYDPEVYWQFVQVIKGLGDACRRFGTPVADNDVSFFNQSVFPDRTEPVFPTPTVGMLGLIDDPQYRLTPGFQAEGHQIYLIGTPNNDLSSSEYLRLVHGISHSPAPRLDIDEELQVQQSIRTLIRRRLLASATDLSEGGLFMALLEAALANELGFRVETDPIFRKDAYLFGESQSRILVTVSTDQEDDLVNYLNSNNVSFTRLGEVGGDRIAIDEEEYGTIAHWKALYGNPLSEQMES